MSKWFITGDIHGDPSRFYINKKLESNSNIIILGDSGCNFFLDFRDTEIKTLLQNIGYKYYILRGNHDIRPQDIDTIKSVYDETIKGEVFVEDAFPNIKYFKDGEIYNIDNYRVLTIGGAYSVDKYFRIKNNLPWFANEQLSPKEMKNITNKVQDQCFDFVLTHTCPYSWQPTDLFIDDSLIDKSLIDNSMEFWLDDLSKKISYKIWLFGHYHADRVELPNVEIFFRRIDELNSIYNRHIFNQLENVSKSQKYNKIKDIF